jgi:hypothetical protein
MTVANFDQLCKGVCEVAGCAMPDVAVSEHGAAAASVLLDGVEVTLGHDPLRGANMAFVITRFGPLPAGQALLASVALLQTNSAMLGNNSPCFGYDPLTHDVLLHHTCPFDTATPVSVHQSIVRFVAIAREWRTNHFLPSAPAGTPGAPQASYV